MQISTDDVIKQFRSDVGDPLRGPVDTPDADALWKIVDVQFYLNAAASKVARDTYALRRTFDVPVTANEPFAKLPASTPVVAIYRAYLNTARRLLDERNLNSPVGARLDYGEIMYSDDNWTTATGTPQFYNREYKDGYLRLSPIPTANDTLTLTAALDAPTLTSGALLPFTTYDDVHLVLLWMKKLAYTKQDTDTYDPKKADAFEGEYAMRALDRRYAVERSRRAPGVTRFSW